MFAKYLILVFAVLVLPASSIADEQSSTITAEGSLTEGDPIPADVMVRKTDGTNVNLSKTLTEQPSVLIFYRGGW